MVLTNHVDGDRVIERHRASRDEAGEGTQHDGARKGTNDEGPPGDVTDSNLLCVGRDVSPGPSQLWERIS